MAANGREAVNLTQTLHPDLVLMDIKMPEMNGVQATKLIHERFPQVRVLVLTTYDEDDWVIDAVRAGAAGYLLKDTPQEALIEAIVDTVKGRSHIDPQVAGKILNQVARPPTVSPLDKSVLSQLSDREREVLQLLATGLSNTDIAHRLFLSEGTVKNYISTIFSKLGVTDRTQAALLAIRAGLVYPGEN